VDSYGQGNESANSVITEFHVQLSNCQLAKE
jgi:hypothetical protein